MLIGSSTRLAGIPRKMNIEISKHDLLQKLMHWGRYSIATTLKISGSDYAKSIDAQTAVNRCLTIVMSIGYNRELGPTVDELIEYGMGDLGPTKCSPGHRHDLETEVQACYNTFRAEAEAFVAFHTMCDRGVKPGESTALANKIDAECKTLTDLLGLPLST
jgi:hypothetical protein